MSRLVIRHEPGGEGRPRFAVLSSSAKSAPVVELDDPLSLRVGETALLLGDELTWYLEEYLDYPFGPNVQRAERVVELLEAWGSEAFETLFGSGLARDSYRDATRAGHTELHLAVSSDDARILAWPWEALHDPLVGDLAHHCRIERQLNEVAAPPELHPGLSRERIGILLVTARPYEGDVGYRSISRPLVELIHNGHLPATVKVLRPPTLDRLRDELRNHPGAYHIVHFDGHGGFGHGAMAGDRFQGPQGRLIFEKEDGSEDSITGAQLSALLREHRIPIAVLNACQSATLGGPAMEDAAEDAFASVATSLLRAGVRSVVAMGYSLYVSAAQVFLPELYRRLFATGSVAEATRAGRQELLRHPERRPGFELQDWLVPVLYQQEPLELTFAATAAADTATIDDGLPAEARLDTGETPYGLIGRDSAVLALERASRRPPPALLVHGLGGIGKTTLARGYLDWLAKTQGLPERVLWQSFAGVRSFDYVRNRLVEALFGTNAMAAPDAQKWPALTRALRDNDVLIVWDNFETVADLPDEDRAELKAFMETLRGGKTRILITSRSDEAWLGTTACFRVAIGGLQGEEQQELARAILSDLGIPFDPYDQSLADLLAVLEGHPLMMRAMLSRLGTENADAVRKAFERYVPEGDSTDPLERKIHATLRYVEEGLPPELRPLLTPIGLHEGYVEAEILASIAESAGQALALPETRRMLELLEAAGIVQGFGGDIFRLHPALTRYLRARQDALPDAERVAAWQRGFVEVMARLADDVTPRPPHEQHGFFTVFGASFERARTLAEGGAFEGYAALTQSLGFYAQNQRNLPLAERYFEAFARQCERHARESHAASAYHQLGMVAGERRDFAAAEEWYRKSVEIKERLGDELGTAKTYHQLGRVAEERRDFNAAEGWYRKGLDIFERLHDDRHAASTYHQLGIMAEERRDFDAAEAWYSKSLRIKERLGDEPGAAKTYHQLGRVAQARRDFDAAEGWYRRSIGISERLGDEPSAAITYHQLGRVAQARRDFDAAEGWYRRSLQINERLGDERGAAITYHQLGMVAQSRRDFDAAEGWSRRSLEIKERLGDEHSMAITYHQLGIVAAERRDFAAAEGWFRKSLEVFERLHDDQYAEVTRDNLEILASARRGEMA